MNMTILTAFSQSRKRLSDSPYEPPRVPASAESREDIVRSVQADGAAINKLVYSVLTAISLEKDALAQPYFYHIEPATLNLSNLVFQDASCYIFCRAQHAKEVVESASELWKTALAGRRLDASFQHRWPAALDTLLESAKDLRKVGKPARPLVKQLAALPEKDRKIRWSLIGNYILRKGGLDAMRQLLRVLRAISEMSAGIALAMSADDQTASRDDTPVIEPSGPFAPNGFRHEGKESFVPRPLVWRLISALWAAKNWTASIRRD